MVFTDVPPIRRKYNTHAAYLLRLSKLPDRAKADRLTLPVVRQRLETIITILGVQSELGARAQTMLLRFPAQAPRTEDTMVGESVIVDFPLTSGDNVKVPCKITAAKRSGRRGYAGIVMYEVTPIGGKGSTWVTATRASKLKENR